METADTKLKKPVPIVAIRGSVVFPHTDSILSFGREKSVAAINAAFQSDKVVAIFSQKDEKVEDPAMADLYPVGTIATISQMMSSDGETNAMVVGQARVSLKEIVSQEPFLAGYVTEIGELEADVPETQALANQLAKLFRKSVNLGKSVDITTVMRVVAGQIDPTELVDSVSSVLDIKTSERQRLLEMASVKDRLTEVIKILNKEINIMDLEKMITAKTQKRFEEQMRKAMLREKKRTIEQELEGGDEEDEDLAEYKKKIKAAKMPKEVKAKAEKELKRLGQLSIHNPEGAYIRNYLDWLCEMPWSKTSPNNVSVSRAEKILDQDHYGLEKAKERILEYLAVMKLKSKKLAKKGDQSQPTILCFIGPPGVGKTSIGRSIAKALKRKFVRVSLGGIRDEAEIRGHRRTYVGALPGRIIQGIKDAGTRNPVFMLDEIDKIGTDFRGDPSSALLEALDPEQNKEFSDHYLEVPFDLSEVIFIATGNVLETIPPALKDRMEVIQFAGYTEEEKIGISKNFLWPKQLRAHGLEDKKLKIDDKSLQEVISRYTREAGVRNLERNLATICRKIARLIAENKKYQKTIALAQIRKYLGPQKFSSLIAEKADEVGMVTGLSVTAAGGEIIFIEVALMPGKGKLTLTGQLGEVMKESAKAAFTWAKAHWDELGLKENFASGIDIHLHVPEGAVPKDGPSAGVSMATALISALTNIPVKREVGMTGELTLRGRVLEIGGVKQKVIAGHHAGLKTIILPKENKKDMEDVPAKVQKDIKFVFATNLEEVLEVAMKKWPPAKRKMGKIPSRPTFLAN
jgi:ATP-dependent Lon protease